MFSGNLDMPIDTVILDIILPLSAAHFVLLLLVLFKLGKVDVLVDTHDIRLTNLEKRK